MSKDVAMQKLKQKYPTLKVIKQHLFSQTFPQRTSQTQFIPFVSQRDDLGRIISLQHTGVFKAVQPINKTNRKQFSKKRSKDEIGLDNLLSANLKKQKRQIFSFGCKLTKHEFKNEFEKKQSLNKIEHKQKLKLIKKGSIPQVFPFYDLSNHDQIIFKRTPVFRIIPPKKITKQQPQFQNKQQIIFKDSLIKPTFKTQKFNVKMLKVPKLSRQQRRNLKITQNLDEQLHKFEVKLDQVRNFALRVKNQTTGLKSYVK